MNIETRNLGVTNGDRLEQQAQRALGSALDRFEDRVRRVRVRFISGGRPDAICRVRVWCGRGPTVVIEEHAANGTAAVDAAAETLARVLQRRWSGRRARRLRAAQVDRNVGRGMS